MPLQAPQWTEYLSCPVCENGFDLKNKVPVSLGCGHTVCQACLATLQRSQCPFDQCTINLSLDKLPVNTALALLIDPTVNLDEIRTKGIEDGDDFKECYASCMAKMEKLASYLRPAASAPGVGQLSRPMQRKLVTVITCQLLEEEGRSRSIRAARSLGERSVTELILQHQNPQQLSANLWAAVRARGCQFLGPAMQEEVLKLVLLALEDGSALSRKVLVMFVVQRLEPHFPQASKTSIGHVVQLLYRASCFKVTKRDGDSSLMQLKEEFRTYETLRREHDAQIVQIATEAGLRIAPDQWSSLLYGDSAHKSHMQSIIDKLQTPQSFLQSIQELVIAHQRTGDPGHLASLRPHLDHLSAIDASPESEGSSDWNVLAEALNACSLVVAGLLAFMSHHHGNNTRKAGMNSSPTNFSETSSVASGCSSTSSAMMPNTKYKTSMCRDLAMHGSCPRGKNCTFAHSMAEIDQFRHKRTIMSAAMPTGPRRPLTKSSPDDGGNGSHSPVGVHPVGGFMTHPGPAQTPVAQVAPVPRGIVNEVPPPQPVNPNPAMILPQPQQRQQPPQMHHPPGLHLQQLPPARGQGQQPHQPGQAPLMQDHLDELQRNRRVDYRPDNTRCSNKDRPDLAVKSLSALKSRKNEIIGNLEDIVGKEETERLSQLSVDRATSGKSECLIFNKLSQQSQTGSSPNRDPEGVSPSATAAPPPVSAAAGVGHHSQHHGGHGGQFGIYSPWTTRSIITINSSQAGNFLASAASYPVTVTPEDELIPFSETPQISRFGPISRRVGSGSVVRSCDPAQSQAVIPDEPTPTAVLRNSKQMARPAATLLQPNGTVTALQPVVVGVNGEIGFIPIEEEVMVAPPTPVMAAPPTGLIPPTAMISPQPQQQQQQQRPPPAQEDQQRLQDVQGGGQPEAMIDPAAVYAESMRRMKHELAVLQQKISELNMQQQLQQQQQQQQQQLQPPQGGGGQPGVQQQVGGGGGARHLELASELQLIEKTIRDREIELQMNHMVSDAPRGYSQGSYLSQGLLEKSDEAKRFGSYAPPSQNQS